MVAKIDMGEINEQYLRAGLIAGLISLVTVVGAALLFVQLGEPMIRRMRESEQRYRNLVEAQPDPICQFLPDTTLTFVNRAYAVFYGRKPEELIGKRWLDFAAADERPRFLEELASFRPEYPERQEETRSTRADHQVRWYLCHLYSFFDDAGRIVSFQTFGTDITQRKLAENALAESERTARAQLVELESLYHTAPIGLCLLDTSLRYVRINEKLAEINGVAAADHIDRTVREVVPGVVDVVEPIFRKVMETGESVTDFEVQGKTPKAPGVLRYWIENWYPLKESDGSVVAVGVTVQEVTEQKRAEAALRESEARLRAVLDACPDEIMLVSPDGIVLATNEAAERRMTKRSAIRDPVGDHLDRLLPADEAEQKKATIQQVASTATVVYRESEVRARSYECWYFPAFSPDRSIVAVAVYARDVSEQKETLAEVRKLSQAIEYSPSTVFITDSDGKIEYVNPKFTELTGYTSAEAVGQNPRMLKSGHTPPERYAELWNTILSGGVWRGELLNKKKNGKLYWEFASIAPVMDGQAITNFVAVMEDITIHREREEQLRQAQKMEAVGQLTGGIAHDFNNLLAIVMGNLQLLRDHVSGNGEAQEYLDDAIWSAQRGGELTRRLLAFARKQPLKPTAVNLNDVVRGMGELLRRTLGATIHVEEKLAPNLGHAVVDPRGLEQALLNLAVNSRDAMPNGGTLTLETRNAVLDEDYAEQFPEVRPGEYALLEIVDTGTGMPAEIASRAFEPFFTTKEFGKGSGLGLSMVYGFVKQSNGHVSIYSQVGRGACVKLYLPRAPSATPGTGDALPDVSTAGLADKVVLVVEDEAKLRKVAVKMLERLGMPIVHAEDAKQALELLARTHIDVLFTDIELPGGMSGLELAEAARRIDPEIKVLFTTGYTREAVQGGRLLQGETPWLIKPYSYPELARALQVLLAVTEH
ncbi:MAG: PAS domain S-box protein [Hyphomicrobiales bacterium]